MCRCRSDGPNQECGSGSCGRYRIAVGDCRRRLHRSQVHRQKPRRRRLFDSLPDQSGDAQCRAQRQSAGAGRTQRLCGQPREGYAPAGLRRDDHGLFFSRRSAEVQRSAGCQAGRRFQGVCRQEVRFLEKVQGDGEFRRRGLGDVPRAGRTVVDARPAVRAERHRRQAVVRSERIGAQEDAGCMELPEKERSAETAPCRTDDRLRCGQHRRAAHHDPQTQTGSAAAARATR